MRWYDSGRARRPPYRIRLELEGGKYDDKGANSPDAYAELTVPTRLRIVKRDVSERVGVKTLLRAVDIGAGVSASGRRMLAVRQAKGAEFTYRSIPSMS